MLERMRRVCRVRPVCRVTIHRWVRRFTPVLVEAAHCARHAIRSRWQVDETYPDAAAVSGYALAPLREQVGQLARDTRTRPWMYRV